MEEKRVDQNNYDAVSISQPGRTKRANHIQPALYIESSRIERPGRFIDLFADMFRCENVAKRYI
jgi:hypothetical protein